MTYHIAMKHRATTANAVHKCKTCDESSQLLPIAGT